VSAPVAARPDCSAKGPIWLAALGAVCGIAVVVPPLGSLARTSETANALQFAVLALLVPALMVIGAPWRRLGAIGRLAERHAARTASSSGFVALAVQVMALVAWRTPVAVTAVRHHGWLLGAEVLTLVGAGVALWLELVASPPMTPRTSPSRRIVLAAIAMWAVWIVAYVAGMSHGQGYPGFQHLPGHGLSGVADKQLATGLLWLAAAAAYLPVVFSNLFVWLRAEERAASDATAWRLRPDRPVVRPDEVRTAG
jgi:cytochrome c oxidase assembly factor CtaG